MCQDYPYGCFCAATVSFMASKKKAPDTQKKQAPKSSAKKKAAGAKAKAKKTPAKKVAAKKAQPKKVAPANKTAKPKTSTTTSASSTTFTINVSDFVTPEQIAETITTVSGIAPLVLDSVENKESRKKLVAKLFGWLKKKS